MSKLLDNINSPKDLKKLNNNQLNQLAKEIRNFLIDNVSKTGGHIASNLGVVELTLAIHKVFDSPNDKIIWDVGHQSYVHKIITGRKNSFETLRQFNGLSGFPKKAESIHDVFDTGHSSNSISASLGIAKARDLMNDNYSVVSIIGDGALTGGMAFEALNNADDMDTSFIVILNDNHMSISQNVGGLSNYLNKLRTNPHYFRLKYNVDKALNKIPVAGKFVAGGVEKIKDSIKYIFVPGIMFEEFGFTYLGPINGHDINELITVLNRAKNVKGPVFIHTITQKGKGYVYSENYPDKFHGIGPFNYTTGEPIKKKTNLTYSNVLGNKITELAKSNEKIVAITAAMPDGTGLKEFSLKFPNRFFDVGIAEQHAVTFAAGLAVAGLKPVFCVYSTFLQRAYDQIIQDVCLQNLPVVFCIDRSGIVGADGETHHGIFDLSYLTHIPNITIMSPKDGMELECMLEYAFSLKSPVAIRYPRGEVSNINNENIEYKIIDNSAEILTKGNDLCIIAIGNMVKTALDVADELRNKDIHTTVINARFAKPIDKDTILNSIENIDNIITLEDNITIGGFGSLISDLIQKNSLNKNIKILGWPDKFIEHGSAKELYDFYKLSKEYIVKESLNMIKNK